MHLHAEFRPQRDERIGLDSESFLQSEMKSVQEQNGHDHELLHGEMIADATAWSRAERKVNYWFGRGPAFGGEARGIELVRIFPEAFAPVEIENRHDNVHADRNLVTAEFVFFGASPADRPDGRINAERFFDHFANVSKRIDV